MLLIPDELPLFQPVQHKVPQNARQRPPSGRIAERIEKIAVCSVAVQDGIVKIVYVQGAASSSLSFIIAPGIPEVKAVST